MSKQTVFVGLSGGVDSSVSAALLQKAGYNVVGIFIKVWQPDFFECTWREDRLDAIRICAKLKIPFKTLNLEKEYKKEVVDYMISEYEAGRTPNPDVMCNRFVKFGGFYDWAIKNGADFVATGHYVQTKTDKNGLVHLLEGKDDNKDQSYFLWTISQEKLKKCLFPIGALKKPEVRKIADKLGLATAVKKDSQGLCFIGQIPIKDFLRNFIKAKRGDVKNEQGEIIGYHDGAYFYTIGQRHGFTITKNKPDNSSLYVLSKDVKNNVLTVSTRDPNQDNLLNIKEVIIKNENQISQLWQDGLEVLVRVRYRQKAESAKLAKINNRWTIIFKKPQSVVAVGQSAVIYKGNDCLGGGIIDETII
ncbi:MAG: tRNA 2-thiouridine(34) synthase MnmA [Minisyncoccia bacterium]